jgi:Fur family iron response transcriptional regulator
MININIYTKKLRESGLRPTKQRLKICEVLFSSEKTFHFTINDLTRIIENKLS